MGHDSMSKVSTVEYVAAYYIAIYDQTAVIKYHGQIHTYTGSLLPPRTEAKYRERKRNEAMHYKT